MLNTINISISARLAIDNLMFDANGNHIPNDIAIKAGSPEKSRIKYIAFLIKMSNHIQIHAYKVFYNATHKCSAIPSSIFKWPEQAKDLIMEKWNITITQPTADENIDLAKDPLEVPDPTHIYVV